MQPAENIPLPNRLTGTNINPVTFLATDYLNHFNEVIMLLDMVSDVPECIEDLQDWMPRSYEEHFINSSFSDKSLAVEAYRLADSRYREPLDRIADLLNAKVCDILVQVQQLIADDQLDACADLVRRTSHAFKTMIELASAIINGTSNVTTASDVEALLSGDRADNASQDEIDKLF